MAWLTYFSLLMWKNFIIKFRHKVEICLEIILPIVFLCIIVAIRSATYPVDYQKPTLYEPCSIGADSLLQLRTEYSQKVSLWEIDYAPNHPLLQELVEAAALQLDLDFRGFNTPAELQQFMIVNQSFVGVVFDLDDKQPQKGLSPQFTYSLRFPGGLRTTDITASISTWDTDRLFPSGMDMQGPRRKDSNTGGNPGYIVEGFMAVQNAISSSFIKLASNNSIELPNIQLQRFPYPPYVDDPVIRYMGQSLGIIIVLAFMFPCIQAIKHVTVEKDRQLKEAMKIMGLSTSLHWIAWFTTIFVVLLFVVFFVLFFLRVPWFEDFTVAVFTYSSWTVLLVYFLIYAMSCITFCFMVSSFFTKASIAGPIGALVWFLSYIPYLFTTNSTDIPYEGNVALSLLINTACPLGCSVMLNWEGLNIGIQWYNLFESPNAGDAFSVGVAMIMMIVDGIIYMLIALYVEKIMPGSYGTSYKWYFLFTKSFWCPNGNKYVPLEESPASSTERVDRFEPEMGSKNKVGVQLINLKKEFASKVAVDNLSMKMYENQITVLLGHNGAGKTTTISMITGLISPNSGTAIINGYDMLENFNEIRKHLGFCPQYNILFDELTVEEHIRFYSQLKGIPKDRLQAETSKYLRILNIENIRNVQSTNLSGGMKRKLSVGIALCGDSKVVLCDEPSSGMDPAARRSLWELLQTEKKGRTILLTTHLMDEADVLGDRIAIMSGGRLECSGTPFFLKKRFGTGYKLICSKESNCDTKPITELIQEFIPEATVKTDVGMELTYQLPEKYSRVFEPMLRNLEAAQTSLGLNGYGISMTTLEDVFLKTGVEAERSYSQLNNFSDGSSLSVKFEPHQIDTLSIVSPKKRILYQWEAMIYKKSINFVRNWYLFLIQLLVPIVFILLGYWISKTSAAIGSLPPLTITLDGYESTVTLLRNNAENNSLGNRIAQNYANMFATFPTTDALSVVHESIQEAILTASEANIQNVNQHFMVATTIGTNQIVGWFSNQALHTAPLTLNLIYNAIARTILGNNTKITVINDPLPLSTNYQLDKLKGTGTAGFQLAVDITFSMAYVSSIFIMFLITERVSKSKLLQFVSGVRLGVFWLAHYLCDLFVYMLIAALVVLVMLGLQQEGFKTGPDLGRLFLIFVLYGFASLPMTYLVSFFFDEPATGLARLSIIHIFTGDALFILAFILSAMGLGDTLQKILIIFPNFALAQAVANQAILASTNSVCISVANEMEITVSEVCELASQSCCNLEPFGWETPGIARPLICMFGIGCLLFILLISRERRSKESVFSSCCRAPFPQETPGQFDEDVQNEKLKVAKMQENEIQKSNLVLRDLTKFYKKFLAVNRISVAVNRGECFGLLGVNGAGKTSAFKMMTGDETISYGDIWIEGKHVQRDRSDVYELIGYCPQYDALLLDFTGMEMLKLFSTLRGVPKQLIEPLCKLLAVNLAFDKHLYKKVKEYSGGNRRKLSTAVALLGNPHLIFLDEPTAGVDPASRRRLWDVVCEVRDIGKAIILTSHSMEECEALCTRIAIMVNGEFKCIGSAQYLKNKYSPGITLIVKMEKERNEDFTFTGEDNGHISITSAIHESRDSRVSQFIKQNFQGAELKDQHKNLLTFEIPGHMMPYSEIFGLMEANKNSLGIEDYSLNQGTLEQVFLTFTYNQSNS